MGEPADPQRTAVMPVSVADQDRILVRHRDLFVGVTAVRAYPQAVMLQLLVKTRSIDQTRLRLAFGLPHLLSPGDLDFGADLRDAAGHWHPTTVNFAGGGGGTDEPDGEGHYEFAWWVSLSADDRGLRLWCAWPAVGVARGEAELDLDLIAAASRACRPVWPA
jgi:hypothetical protein